VVPKLGVNYLQRVICNYLGGVTWNQNHNVVLCYERSLRYIEGNLRHNRYLDLGNGSNRFGNHWFNV